MYLGLRDAHLSDGHLDYAEALPDTAKTNTTEASLPRSIDGLASRVSRVFVDEITETNGINTHL
jgi:hypothetical protein